MRIYGSDFTSAPSKRKPITLAACSLQAGVLRVDDFERLTNFGAFEAFLMRSGTWVAGLDFPFGQPQKLIDNLGLPKNWSAYVEHIEAMGKQEWVAAMQRYMAPRDKGDKLHFRAVDKLAGAQSPMKMSFIPVGRMFYEGAPRLLHSGANVLPNRPNKSRRTVLEVYPALVARQFVGRGSGYKSDDTAKQTDAARHKRERIVDGLRSHCTDVYGFAVDLPAPLAGVFINDATGDTLDAFLGAVQAAWAYTQHDNNYGIPPGISPAEGWIADPVLLTQYEEQAHE